jgi:hypothetical protein
MNSPFWTICSPSKLSFSFYFVLLFILNLIISLNEWCYNLFFYFFAGMHQNQTWSGMLRLR